MQHAGARLLREDGHEYDRPAPSRRLRVVGEDDVRELEVDGAYTHVYAENGRRTVKITGQPLPPRRRRSPAQTQIQARPDRIALWAFLLGLFLVFMAVATANATAV
jgi:hypothetical protein